MCRLGIEPEQERAESMKHRALLAFPVAIVKATRIDSRRAAEIASTPRSDGALMLEIVAGR